MDATLKRRMWKVAKVHLALTLFAIFTPVAFYIISRSSFFPDRYHIHGENRENLDSQLAALHQRYLELAAIKRSADKLKANC